MSIEYIMDRFAIQDALTRFSTAIDTGNLALLDQVFAADAFIDYGDFWGPGDLKGFKQWATENQTKFSAWQHLLANMVIEIDGDTARTKTDFYNPLITTSPGTEPTILHAYGRYHDTLKRRSEGWRIAARKMEPILGVSSAKAG